MQEDCIEQIWDLINNFEGLEDETGRYKNGLEMIIAIYLINSESLSSKYSEFIKVGLLG